MATAAPKTGPGPSTGQDVLTINITGCGQPAASPAPPPAVSVAISTPVSVTAAKGVPAWAATTTPLTPSAALQMGATTELRFNVSWELADAAPTATLAGSISVSAGAEAANITRVTLMPSLERDGGATRAPSVMADCDATSLDAGKSAACKWQATLNLPAGGSSSYRGSLTAEVQLAGGATVTSSAVPFTVDAAAAASDSNGSGAPACAEVVTGLMLGPALAVPGAAGPAASQQLQACGPGSKLVTQTVGPFTAPATYTVRAVATSTSEQRLWSGLSREHTCCGCCGVGVLTWCTHDAVQIVYMLCRLCPQRAFGPSAAASQHLPALVRHACRWRAQHLPVPARCKPPPPSAPSSRSATPLATRGRSSRAAARVPRRSSCRLTSHRPSHSRLPQQRAQSAAGLWWYRARWCCAARPAAR